MQVNSEMKILVVDDFATMRRIVKDLLRQCGFTNIVEANDGSTALQMIYSDQVELIISDWNMPKMTGLELLRAVRHDPITQHLPFLMITAEADAERVVQAIRSGVTNYIVKPFSADVLQKKLDQLFVNEATAQDGAKKDGSADEEAEEPVDELDAAIAAAKGDASPGEEAETDTSSENAVEDNPQAANS
ncbi:MAG: response regulator [Deltaproteobacteria bacterium]|nr:response regulator [bacterium]MCB9478836.1 response regulator [Deltaproteobacteria bacterium]MCB9489002.1 response regulator [Deltaproteobacteria bacterium]